MKKVILFGVTFVFLLTLALCFPKEIWNNSVDSVKSFLGISISNEHGAAGELNFNDLLEDVDANAIDEQKVMNCLNDKGVTFYGGGSCGFSCEDVQKYGKRMKEFTCVDCDENEALCDMANVKKIPLWAGGGRQVKNIKALSDLAIEFGCDA